MIIAADAGNGNTNVEMLLGKGKTKSVSFPSVRAIATGEKLGFGKEVKYHWYEWGGHRYVFGDDVVRVTGRGIERHKGRLRYGNEVQKCLIAKAFRDLGVKSGEQIDLVVCAPPGIFEEVKDDMADNLKGNYRIRRDDDKRPLEVEVTSVTVVPEAISTALAFALNLDGELVAGDFFDGNILIGDGGVFTLDCTQIENGDFNPETLEHATFEDYGIDTYVREPIYRHVQKLVKAGQLPESFSAMTIYHLDMVIRNGLSSGDYTLTTPTMESVDLTGIVEREYQRFAEAISNNVLDNHYNRLVSIKAMVLTGGWEGMVKKTLAHLYPKKIVDRKKYPHVAKLQAVDLNVRGMLCWATGQNG